MHKKRISIAIKFFGIILTLASLYYLFQDFIKYSDDVLSIYSQPFYPVLFVISTLIYVLTFFIIVGSWYIQLNQVCSSVTFKTLFGIIGVSQIAKYFPGNILHIAGRFYMTLKQGVKAKTITNSLIFETILIIVSAMLVGFMYFYYYRFPVFEIEINIYWVAIIALVGALVFYGLNLRESFVELLSGRRVLIILGLFIVSHFLNGSIIYLQNSIFFQGDSSLFMLTAILALSFVVGYVTPGSPGGIGIREFVFVKLAVVELDESVALSLILSLRLISVCGDFLVYVVAMNIKNQVKE